MAEESESTLNGDILLFYEVSTGLATEKQPKKRVVALDNLGIL